MYDGRLEMIAVSYMSIKDYKYKLLQDSEKFLLNVKNYDMYLNEGIYWTLD